MGLGRQRFIWDITKKGEPRADGAVRDASASEQISVFLHFETEICASWRAQETEYRFEPEAMAPGSTEQLLLRPDLSEAAEVGAESILGTQKWRPDLAVGGERSMKTPTSFTKSLREA